MEKSSAWMLSFPDPVGVVRFLAELGSRPDAICNLTGAPKSFVQAVRNDVEPSKIDRGGRRPSAIHSLMADTEMHVFSSVFLKAYIHHSGPGRAKGFLNKQAVVRALWSAYASVRGRDDNHLGDDCGLKVDHALLIAHAYEMGEIDLTQHSHCKSSFMASRKPTMVKQASTYGECPICRGISGIGKTKQPAKVPSKSKLVDLWGDAAGRAQRGIQMPPGIPTATQISEPAAPGQSLPLWLLPDSPTHPL